MKFLEYANGKYSVVDYDLNSPDSHYIQGNYSLHYPVYPRYKFYSHALNDIDTEFILKTVVKAKGYFVYYGLRFVISEITDDSINDFLKYFHENVKRFISDVDVRSLKNNRIV